jgi:retron-type reverse transcriptase
MNNDNRNNTNSVRCVASSRDNPCPFSFKEVYLAYKLCRKRKRPSPDQIRFELKLSESLGRLTDELSRGDYEISPYRCFIVEKPKPREIFAANFRDRVVHHVIVSRLQPIWEKKFHYGSFACRKGKGTHAALKYLIKKHASVSHGAKKEVFFLQLDLASFFVTINRQILFDLIDPTITDEYFRELVAKVILYNPISDVIVKSTEQEKKLIPAYKSFFNREYPDQGIPIGNLTSQFSANVYLNSLDHFVTRGLRVGAYQRYMDDLLLIDTSKEKLLSFVAPITEWVLKYRQQVINPQKTIIGSFKTESMNYLGYRVSEKEGCLRLFAQEDKKWKLVEEARRIEDEVSFLPQNHHQLWPQRKVPRLCESSLTKIRSRLGYFSHSESYRFKMEVIEKLKASIDAEAEFFGVKRCNII